ncbi:Ras-related protein Rab-6A [Tritrichomonas foetus]|uniref:Ras-related protein Rab-6A n=1 Tax=Tritrichomonas foetus TaxID=1144522 RepID=A0A1J4KJF8_9EUKA|nr:Ras-related protein Rab-6A [Tritrichomonas foetus]|eukprot:OHT11234.1 Ras-related protein Rab-6A [Tritrichomonas foetus]
MSCEPAERVKVVILGTSNVGKTCLIHRWISGTFPVNQTQTIGSAYFSQIIEVDGRSYDVNIWDTAGQEQFHSLTPVYCQGSSAGLIVFDITNVDSFSEVESYIDLIQGVNNSTFMIVGNKLDLKDKRAISYESGVEFAKKRGVTYLEVSAVSGQGVDEMFNEFCLQAVNAYLTSKKTSSETISVDLQHPKNQKPGCC